MLKFLVTAGTFVSLSVIAAPSPFTGIDYSGHYQCTGHDSHASDFEGVVHMTLDRNQSTADHGAYTYTMTMSDNTVYDGFAAATGASMGIYFSHKDPASKDYGVGIANFEKSDTGKFQFNKYYYGPHYEGGGHGQEKCVQR